MLQAGQRHWWPAVDSSWEDSHCASKAAPGTGASVGRLVQESAVAGPRMQLMPVYAWSASCHKQSWMQGWGTSAASPPKPAAASRMSCSRGKQCHPATALNGKCVNSLLYLLYACPLLVMPSPHQNNGVTGCSVTMHCALFRHMMSTRETAASARRGPAVWRCKCVCHRAGRQAGTPCAPQKLHAARMRRCSLPRLQTSMCPCTASPPFVSQTCCNMQRKAMNQVDRWGPNVRDLQSTAIARSNISLCASWPQLEDIRECRALHPHVRIVIGRIQHL